MTLYDIAGLLGIEARLPEIGVYAVTEDSRRVGPGAVFVAVAGEHGDGHDYAEAAIAAGAVAILGDRRDVAEMFGKPYIHHESPRRAAALIAHALAGNPSRDMRVVGVTGTNGKTSVACLTQAILRANGQGCANFGTLGYDFAGDTIDARHTTPFGEDLAALFARARDRGLPYVVMEASSHALAQGRVAGIAMNIAAMTNLTRDHLDYHQDMESYLRAKLRLFEMVRDEAARGVSQGPFASVVNQEDPAAKRFMDVFPENCLSYGDGGQVRSESAHAADDGTAFQIVSPWGRHDARIHLVGRHNILNALCAFTVCAALGVPPESAAAGLAALPRVPGRFEPVTAGQDFQVVVDYAHTDDGLINALRAARAGCAGRIILVFGCGGDRDKGKRPKMGDAAAKGADYCIVTSDNPRTEEPHRILLDIEVGLQHAGKVKGDDYRVIEARDEAIVQAIALARAGDLVLIAGKGHEDYQIVGNERRHFDDREEALKALRARLQ